ncbi:60S ribosomal protein L18a-like protein [Hibiscus syriacus]|uniref:60S ribosomal protein L18a-like protein n=1 Tax=Hibiscus syriacus TaxID=106335 RepID=UPI0019230C3A|nr:60S ribosomal protein L18a-like protein [Hibiscus syriacus]
MNDEGRNRGSGVDQQQQNQYGTFQGVANYPPPRPPRPHQQQPRGQMGLPQPSPPPSTPPQHYPRGYKAVPGYVVDEGGPEDSLPCCGLGVGWFLFIIGFFLGAIPWYIGVVILACSTIDYREKPGYVACSNGAVIATIALLVGLITK